MSTATVIDGSCKGYVRLYRKILENPLFKDKPAAWFKIWVYILLRANWRESVFRPRQGESIPVPAGSFHHFARKAGNTRRDAPKNTPLDDDNRRELGGLPAI